MADNIIDHQKMAIEVAAAIRMGAACATPGWPAFMVLERGLLDGKVEQRFKIGLCPIRGTESGELVKVHFNIENGLPLPEPFTSMLANELKPLIIGIGEVWTKLTPEGIVLMLRDDGDREDLGHSFRS